MKVGGANVTSLKTERRMATQEETWPRNWGRGIPTLMLTLSHCN